ncbi:MAG: hypothetical protein HKM04_00500 [Legionellales bacterium]|nr:hypothetical protein [Legionellales bacterium]
MRKNYRIKKLFFIFGLFSFSPCVLAASVMGTTPAAPLFVLDTNSVDSLTQLKSEVQELSDQYTQLTEMYTSLQNIDTSGQNIHGDLNGLFKINGQSVGELYNNISSESDSWKWTESTWDKELQSLSGGNNDRYKELKKQYEAYYPNVMTKDTYAKGSTPEAAQAYAQASAVNQTALTEATYQFSDLNNRLSEIQNLSKQIGSATTEKEALDLNSKLAVQQAYIQVEMLRMQTLVNQQVGQVQAEKLEGQAGASNYYSDHLPTN